jgi:hypothetical protein
MFPIRLLVVASVALLPGVSAAQEGKPGGKKPEQYVKLSAELKGRLEQPLLGGDSVWRAGFAAKGGGRIRLAVRVGEEIWELQLPDDQTTPQQAAKLVGQEVVIHGQLEPAPPGWSFPPFNETQAGPLKGYVIRVTSLKAADGKK